GTVLSRAFVRRGSRRCASKPVIAAGVRSRGHTVTLAVEPLKHLQSHRRASRRAGPTAVELDQTSEFVHHIPVGLGAGVPPRLRRVAARGGEIKQVKQGGAERRIEREGSAERRASPLRCVWKTELQTAVEVLVRQLLPQLDIVRIVRRTALRRRELLRGWG